MVENKTESRIKEHLKNSERIIAYCELLFLIGISLLYFFAPKPTDSTSTIELSQIVFGLFYLMVGSKLIISHKYKFSRYLIHTYCALEMILLTALIYSFHIKYQQSISLSLKAPTFVYYFYFVALQSIRFNPSYLLASAFWAVICWLSLSLHAVWGHPEVVTHSFTEYILGDKVLLGAEVEKLTAIFAVAATLALGVYRYRKNIVESMSKLEESAKELDQKNRDLENSKIKLENANNIKNQFLTLISHELRTPINGILGSIEHLGDSKEKSQQDTEELRRSALGLKNTVDGILEFLEYDGGRQASTPEVFSVKEMFDKTHQQVRRDLNPGVNWETSFDEKLAYIKGPAKEFFSCLYIIIGNAVRFTEKGSVSLHLSEQNGLLCLEARDTGEGIPESSLESIFEAFHQGDNSTSRKVEGLGLGLARLNMIVKLLNGRIKLKSNHNGTSIMIGFILNEFYSVSAAPKIASSSADLSGHTILIVEDNPLNLKITQKMLEKLGIGHLSAEDGEKSLLKLQENPDVDLILMDCQMPIMDGYEATERIRRDLSLDIPIVCLLYTSPSPRDLSTSRMPSSA